MLIRYSYNFLFIILVSSLMFSVDYVSTGSFGAVALNGKIYNQLSLKPEITHGKLGVGLDLYIYIDENGEIYEDSWDFSDSESTLRTLLDKIYYVRWGQPYDKFYFKAGALDTYTLGHGILVNNYSNIIERPQIRRIGLNMKYRLNDKIKFEYFQSDFKRSPGLIAFGVGFDLMPRTVVKVNYATDLNQNSRLEELTTKYDRESLEEYYNLIDHYVGMNMTFDEFFEMYELNASGNKDQVSGFSIGVDYRLAHNIVLYSEYAQLIGMTTKSPIDDTEQKLGSGIIPLGLGVNFGRGSFNIEYRKTLSDNFIFNYWNRSYDVERCIKVDEGVSYTKESTLNRFGDMEGLFANFSYDVLKVMNFSIGYQDMQGSLWNDDSKEYKEDNSKTFLSTITINPSLIPKVKKAQIFYQSSNVPNPFEIAKPSSSTIHGYDIGLEVSTGVVVIYKARTTYRLEDGEYEPIKTMELETQFIF